MASESVLLTGATGSLGASILEHLLTSGHRVNAVLRSFARSRGFLEKKYARQYVEGILTFTEIPDMAVPGAFDEFAATATAIVHVATPLAFSDFEETIIKPTWTIDHNILEAANKSNTVKRVVITGSVVSVTSMSDLFSNRTLSEKDWAQLKHEEASDTLQAAYPYAKTMAEKNSWEYMEKKNPGFDLVVLLAPWIVGRAIQGGYAPTKNDLGGISGVYRELFDRETPGKFFAHWADIDDIAILHVLSLDTSAVPGNKRYLFCAPDLLSANNTARKIREEYPQLRSRVPAPQEEGDGIPQPLVTLDTSLADSVFKIKWKSGWESVKAVVEDILAYEKTSRAHQDV